MSGFPNKLAAGWLAGLVPELNKVVEVTFEEIMEMVLPKVLCAAPWLSMVPAVELAEVQVSQEAIASLLESVRKLVAPDAASAEAASIVRVKLVVCFILCLVFESVLGVII